MSELTPEQIADQAAYKAQLEEEVEKARHWRYFIMLEQDFERALRYVEPTEANESTYSLEFSRQLLSICAQFEVLSLRLCRRELGLPNFKGDIRRIREGLLQRFPELPRFGVAFAYTTGYLRPFADWSATKSPDWWKAYNDVKHDPATGFEVATLRNVMDALAALGIVTVKYAHIQILGMRSGLFTFG